MANKHAGGRPPKYSDPAIMQAAIDSYFSSNPSKPTIVGFALFLGFCDRQSLNDYVNRNAHEGEDQKEEFACIIKTAISRIEQVHEERILTSNTPAGSIFWLKNRNWSDRQDQVHSGNVTITIVEDGNET